MTEKDSVWENKKMRAKCMCCVVLLKWNVSKSKKIEKENACTHEKKDNIITNEKEITRTKNSIRQKRKSHKHKLYPTYGNR